MQEKESPPNAIGRWMRGRQAGCLRIRLQMNGMIINTTCGGAVRDSRDRRLVNAATRYTGRWLKNTFVKFRLEVSNIKQKYAINASCQTYVEDRNKLAK